MNVSDQETVCEVVQRAMRTKTTICTRLVEPLFADFPMADVQVMVFSMHYVCRVEVNKQTAINDGAKKARELGMS